MSDLYEIRESEYEVGREEEILDGEMKFILSILGDLGEVSKELTEQLKMYAGLPKFKDILKLAARSESMEQFKAGFYNLVK